MSGEAHDETAPTSSSDAPSSQDLAARSEGVLTSDSNFWQPPPIRISEGFAPMPGENHLSGMPEMPDGQFIYLAPPSSAAKVIGILVIIYGTFGLITGAITVVTSNFTSGNLMLLSLDITSFLLSCGTVAGGVMMSKYQRKGVFLVLLMILLTTVVGVVQLTKTEEFYQQMLDDGDLEQEEYDEVMASNQIIQGVGMFFLALCGGICGLIVAIPLMVSNNGLDQSKWRG